jgi:hypothetical protein
LACLALASNSDKYVNISSFDLWSYGCSFNLIGTSDSLWSFLCSTTFIRASYISICFSELRGATETFSW